MIPDSRPTSNSGLAISYWPHPTLARRDAGELTGPTSEELEEIHRLKRENRDLRETNEILKAAASFLS